MAVVSAGKILAVGPPAHLGGRDNAKATVTWAGPNGTESVATDTPTQLVTELASRFDGEVPSLVVRRPTLEDVYLTMIGASR